MESFDAEFDFEYYSSRLRVNSGIIANRDKKYSNLVLTLLTLTVRVNGSLVKFKYTYDACPRQSCTVGSGRKHFGFFPLISDLFPLEPTKFSLEFIGTNPNIFLSEYCFRIPVISNVFLQDQVGSADWNLHLGHFGFLCLGQYEEVHFEILVKLV